MWIGSRQFWLSAGAALGLSTAGADFLFAQTPANIPAQVVPLDSTMFADFLDSGPVMVPVLHRQDPNALRPNESLQTAPSAATPGSQVARNLLGVPQRGDTVARRGRLRTLTMSQNRASAMIGDLFGGGTTTLTITPTIGEAIPYVSPTGMGPNFNGFATLQSPNLPTGPFYAGTTNGGDFPLLSSIGIDTNGDNVQDTFPGLHQYPFASGAGDPNTVLKEGPFQAVLTDRTVVTSNGDTVPVAAIQQPMTIVNLPSPGAGGGGGVVGTLKIAENTSPMPRDRLFFNYSYFTNVPLSPNGINMNRFTPGFEKTFLDGTSSLEVRLPFATTLNSNITANGITDGDHTEFGNVNLAWKSLVYRDEELAFSGGLQVTIPTADPINVNLADGTTVFKVKNQAVHLMPFVGALYTPDERLFSQGFLQLDVAANGNDVLANLDLTRLRQVGTAQDNTYLYIDWNVGYWAYLSEDDSSVLTGVAPMFELHFNQSLQHNDVVGTAGSFQLGTFGRNYSVLNAVIGTTFQFGQQSSMTMGYSAPIGSGADRQFDGEFRLFFNRRFGPQTRQTRAI